MTTFDLDRIRAALPGLRLDYHAELGSTNSYALELARRGDVEPRLILAGEQTAGRGRGANRWWSADGCLTFTLLAPTEFVAANLRSLTALVVGAAVAETLEDLAPQIPVGLKWPNDVYLSGRKVCGVLIETVSAPTAALAVGVGLNVNNSCAQAPAELRATATSLTDELARTLDAGDVLIAVVRRMRERLQEASLTSEAFVQMWRRYCILSDLIVQIDASGRTLTGRCRGIDVDGSLLLDTESGVEHCRVGTVVDWQ